MCRLCNTKPVYEFTNKRKLCKNCFIHWFEKKFLYTNRKFNLINRGDVIFIKKNKGYRYAVLKDILEKFEDKLMIKFEKLDSLRSRLNDLQLTSSSCSLKNKLSDNKLDNDLLIDNYKKSRAKRGLNKIAIRDTIDLEAGQIINILINKNIRELTKSSPIIKKNNYKIIKPLYLFSDEEIILYAKLKKLKFNNPKENKDKIGKLLDTLEAKHPEVKRAVVNSYLKVQ